MYFADTLMKNERKAILQLNFIFNHLRTSSRPKALNMTLTGFDDRSVAMSPSSLHHRYVLLLWECCGLH